MVAWVEPALHAANEKAAPNFAAEHNEMGERLSTQLQLLPPNQQEVIRLKFQHGLSYKEISAVTGLSVSNVGYLLHVAIKRLRELMVD